MKSSKQKIEDPLSCKCQDCKFEREIQISKAFEVNSKYSNQWKEPWINRTCITEKIMKDIIRTDFARDFLTKEQLKKIKFCL